jgi:hypothetical protein
MDKEDPMGKINATAAEANQNVGRDSLTILHTTDGKLAAKIITPKDNRMWDQKQALRDGVIETNT